MSLHSALWPEGWCYVFSKYGALCPLTFMFLANREPLPVKGAKQRGKWCQDICTPALSLKGGHRLHGPSIQHKSCQAALCTQTSLFSMLQKLLPPLASCQPSLPALRRNQILLLYLCPTQECASVSCQDLDWISSFHSHPSSSHSGESNVTPLAVLCKLVSKHFSPGCKERGSPLSTWPIIVRADALP